MLMKCNFHVLPEHGSEAAVIGEEGLDFELHRVLP